jgi:hypothetical protein
MANKNILYGPPSGVKRKNANTPKNCDSVTTGEGLRVR